MAKYKLEDILNEYGPDGKRSGIRRDENKSLAHGTLETEKLIAAATSRKPLSQQRSGYHSISNEPPAEETQPEDLVDIKSTISSIKAQKDAAAARDADVSPMLREHFPTQHLRREGVSYLRSGNRARYAAAENGDDYDGAVMVVSESRQESIGSQHRPNIRQMEDSTRAKEKKRRRKRNITESSYAKESMTGVMHKPGIQPETDPQPRHHWDAEQDFYYQGGQEKSNVRGMRRRMRSEMHNLAAQQQPDDMDLVRKSLYSLRNVIFFRTMSLLLLMLIGVILAVGEVFHGGAIVSALTPRGYAIAQLVLALAGGVISLPTVKNGLYHLVCLRADSDSMAAVPLLTSLIGAVFAVIAPQVLSNEMVHLYVPCAILALLCNTFGRLLVVRRALRNCRVLSDAEQKRVLTYIAQEENAEILTRGLIHDFPIVAAVRKANSLCDFLRYAYSMDAADGLCRTMTPISTVLSLGVAAFLTVVRVGAVPDLLWLSTLFSTWTLLATASCCLASALVSNLPLEWESKKMAAAGSTMLGYQSADDFFDVKALMVEANDLFPAGSVQIQGMKVFSGATVDDVLIDAASLVQHGESILRSAFSEMIPDANALRRVDEFLCEDGLGLCGWIANRRVLFGGREMMANHNIEGLPTKTREEELTEGDGDVLYLSVSGVLSAMFSIRITADSMVRRQMRALRQEQIALVIRTVDQAVTLRRLSSLFDFPEHLMKIIPASMHHLFRLETADLDCVSASVTVGGTGFGAARLLLSARRVRRASTMGVILQVVSALLGMSLAIIHLITGAYSEMTAQFFLLYHVLMTMVTALAVRMR